MLLKKRAKHTQGQKRNYCLSRYQVSLRDICQERYSECTFLHRKLLVCQKKSYFVINKIRISSTPFDAQNAGNRISELLDFKFSWGTMPSDPAREKGTYGPFSANSRLLNLQCPLITKVSETPECEAQATYQAMQLTLSNKTAMN